jgi:hypothetical protein
VGEEFNDDLSSLDVDYTNARRALREKQQSETSTVGDIATGVWRGATEAVDETLKFGREVADGAIEYGSLGTLEGFDDDSLDESIIGVDNWSSKPVTAAGKFTEEIVKFGIGFVGAGKFRMAASKGLTKRGSTLGKKLDTKDAGFWKEQGLYGVDSAVASGVVINPYEDTLAEIAEEYDMAPMITDLLANDVDDSVATMRIKNVVEDVAFSGVITGLIRAVKAMRGGATEEVAEQIMSPKVAEQVRESDVFKTLDSQINKANSPGLRDHIMYTMAAKKQGVTVRELLEYTDNAELKKLTAELGDHKIQEAEAALTALEEQVLKDPVYASKNKESIAAKRAEFKNQLAKALEDNVEAKTKTFWKDRVAAENEAAKNAPPKQTLEESQKAAADSKAAADAPEGTTPLPGKIKFDERTSQFDPGQVAKVREGITEAAKKSPDEFKTEFARIMDETTVGLSAKKWPTSGQGIKEHIEYLLSEVITPVVRDKGVLKFETVRKELVIRGAALQNVSSEELNALLKGNTESVYDGVLNLMVHEARITSVMEDLIKKWDEFELAISGTSHGSEQMGHTKLEADANILVKELMELISAGGELSKAQARALKIRQMQDVPLTNMSKGELQALVNPFQYRNADKSRVKLRNLVDTIKAAKGNKRAIAKAVKNHGKYTGVEKFIASLTELWRGILLASSSTNFSNLASNISETFIIPVERLIGSAPPFRFKRSEHGLSYDPAMKVAHDEAWMHIRYMTEGFTHALSAAKYAFKHERQSLDPYRGGMIETPGLGREGMTHAEMNKTSQFQVSSNNWGLDPKSVMGHTIDGLGSTGRLSFRFLGAADELFKVTTYWANLKAGMHRDIVQRINGDELTHSEGIAELKRMMDDHFEADGFTPKMGDDGNLATNADALEMARDVTHTKPAYEGSIVDMTQKAVNANPVLGIFLPFIRTPSDLINKAYQRTPGIGMLSKRWQADMARGGIHKSQAIGRQIVGTSFVGAGIYYAVQGGLTGRGPDDPRANKIWARTHPRNSILVDGKWVSYNKADPAGILLGCVANIAEAAKNEALMEGDDAIDVVTGIITAVTDTVGQKSALMGVANLATLFSPQVIGKDAQTATIVENHLASWVPSIFQQINVAITDTTYLKEANGLVEKLMRKSPWHQDDLADRYDWITGKRVEIPTGHNWGFPVEKQKHDWVLTEMANLNHGFSGPTHSFNGVELTSHQFSEWSKLMGTLRLPEYGHKTMLAAIQSEMKSGYYAYDPNRQYMQVAGEPDPIQVKLIKRVIRRYKAAAKLMLLRNNPNLVPNRPMTLFGGSR